MLLSYNIEIALEWRIPYLRAGFHELVFTDNAYYFPSVKVNQNQP